MEADFLAVFERLRLSGPATTGIYGSVTHDCRQPDLLDALARLLVGGAKRAPKELAPSRESTLVMVVALKVLIDELDRTLRRP
jgi:hypothetical protein